MKYEAHPVAECFPLMYGRDFDEFVADIRDNGQRQPILVHDNCIIDGRNRFRACEAIGEEPWIEEWDGDGDPTDFIVSMNLYRRHMDESQRGMAARRLATLKQGARTDLELRANLPEVSQARAAEMLNVSERTVKSAGKVIDKGTPELVRAVEGGQVAVSTAADIAELPAPIQKQAVERIDAGEKPAAVKRDLRPLMSSETDEWNTPKSVVELVEKVLGQIDLDPCCNDGEPNVPAIRVFRRTDDGLAHKWSGRIYMNPPYGSAVSEWVDKLVSEYNSGNITEAIALVAARVDTQWFQRFREFAICFVRGRLKFGDSDNSATFPSAAIYLGDDIAQFHDVFSGIGDVWVRYRG